MLEARLVADTNNAAGLDTYIDITYLGSIIDVSTAEYSVFVAV